jgi:hypothetical protein
MFEAETIKTAVAWLRVADLATVRAAANREFTDCDAPYRDLLARLGYAELGARGAR